MDIRQLRYFATVVDTGSLSKAAVRLSVSQPSLSQQIVGMEDDLGVPLLLRSPSGVRPTEAGMALYRHARTILKQFEQMRGDVRRGEHSESGQVAVGLPTSIAAVIAVPLFNRLQADYPNIELQLFESMSGYLIELLANGRLDMAVLFRETETRGLTVSPLFTEHLSLCGVPWVGDPHAGDVALSLIAGVPLVLPGKANGLRLLIERTFAREGLELNVVADIDSLPTMLTIAREGKVGSILSGALARQPGAALLGRRIVEPSLRRMVSLCVPNAVPQNAASRAVQNTIEKIVREEEIKWDRAD
ncbi:LysR substrate-binding domain-containing protein [Paraburkholderia sp. PREW-6R]|uniref:LysR substrate-binding domain-containing protein n=1 Tax=Paraburkholderia sp. PREW-6R TaxID=3141544 RepID=UPI0031F482F9